MQVTTLSRKEYDMHALGGSWVSSLWTEKKVNENIEITTIKRKTKKYKKQERELLSSTQKESSDCELKGVFRLCQ